MTESLEDSVPLLLLLLLLLLYCETYYYFPGAMSFHYHTLYRVSRLLGYTILHRESSSLQQSSFIRQILIFKPHYCLP